MHKSYYSILPCQNKLLQMKWDSYNYKEHRRKVAEAQSTVDTKPPTIYWHQHFKAKKLQLEEERLAQIERDNRLLLEKMAIIMRTRGRIDNRNYYESKSLNQEHRRRELMRITCENADMIKRILARQAQYSREEWKRDWDTNLIYMENISHFPPNWWENKTHRQKSFASNRSSRSPKAKTAEEEGSEIQDEQADKTDEKSEEKNEQPEEESETLKDGTDEGETEE